MYTSKPIRCHGEYRNNFDLFAGMYSKIICRNTIHKALEYDFRCVDFTSYITEPRLMWKQGYISVYSSAEKCNIRLTQCIRMSHMLTARTVQCNDWFLMTACILMYFAIKCKEYFRVVKKVNQSHYRSKVPRGFQEVSQITWQWPRMVVSLLVLRTGRLYPLECSWYSFLLQAESTPGP